MILWGPPGVGKTTLARLLARAFGAEFIAISAVLAGVKEIREAVDRARLAREAHGRATILFVDEVHRFNKAQQDAFLPHVESGLLTFIGATTENPSFEVNGALLSRAQVYVLESLGAEDLDRLVVRGFEAEGIDVTEEARKRIVEYADGDGRRAFNLVELLASAARAERAPGRGRGVRRRRGHAIRPALRQGRRELLRPDLRAAQVGARERPGRGALLDGAHARRRRRPALPRAAHDPHGHRGRGPRRSARPRHRHARGRGVRAPGQPRGGARARRGRRLPRGGGEVERGLRGLRRGPRVRRRRTRAARCRCTCATPPRGS